MRSCRAVLIGMCLVRVGKLGGTGAGGWLRLPEITHAVVISISKFAQSERHCTP
jgi:hypothetical protein